MSQLIGIIVIFANVIYTSYCQVSNQHVEETGAEGEDIWRSTSDFIPQQGTSYGTIRIGKEMSMTFDFTWGGYTLDPRGGTVVDDYENFFRVGCSAFDDNDPDSICTGGTGCGGQSARYPSLWVVPEFTGAGATQQHARMLHVSVSGSGGSGACVPAMDLTEWGEISIGVKLHMNIFFNQSIVIVGIGYYSNYTQNPSTFPEKVQTFDRENIYGSTQEIYLGQDMPVWWMSDKTGDVSKLYNRGNGTFSNITIISKYWPTVAPTTDPTSDPSQVPTSAAPSSSPSKAPSKYPTETPTLQPSDSPTTGQPSIPPTPPPTRPEGGIDGTTPSPQTPSPNTDVGTEGGGGSDSGALDGTMIGIIVGCGAIFCCIVCGICILCKKKKRRKHSSETPGKGMESEFWANHKVKDKDDDRNNYNHKQPMGIQVNNGRPVPPPPRNQMGEAGNSPYTPLTPDGEVGPSHKVVKYLSEAQKKEMQQRVTPMGPEDDSVDNVNNGNELLDDDYGHHNSSYLSQAQKEELRQKQTAKYSSSSKIGLVDRYRLSNGDDHIMVNDSDDDVVGDMRTAGYIGEDVDDNDALAEEPEIPESIKKNTLSHEHDDEMSQDIVEHMKTMGGDEDIDGMMDEDYDDVDEYYDPASPNAMEHKITIGADLDDEEDYNFVMEENVNAMNYDDINDYQQNQGLPPVGSPSDDIYAPAHGPTLG